MKTLYFTTAIFNRYRIRFLFGLNEVTLEPYYIGKNKNGKKVIYGRVNGINEIRGFEFEKISNIKILGYEKFSPIIPIMLIYR